MCWSWSCIKHCKFIDIDQNYNFKNLGIFKKLYLRYIFASDSLKTRTTLNWKRGTVVIVFGTYVPTTNVYIRGSLRITHSTSVKSGQILQVALTFRCGLMSCCGIDRMPKLSKHTTDKSVHNPEWQVKTESRLFHIEKKIKEKTIEDMCVCALFFKINVRQTKLINITNRLFA